MKKSPNFQNNSISSDNQDNKDERLVSGVLEQAETDADRALRPARFKDFVGQTKLIENLEIFVKAAKGREEALDHVLLYGPPGLGKTTLAHVLANEMGVEIKTTSGPVIEKPGDLAAILTQLNTHDVLFIDEIHRLPAAVEEILYPAMEDYKLDIVLGNGPGAQTLKLTLPHFTLIGATTRTGLLSSPFRGRFGVDAQLNFYDTDKMVTIVKRSATLLKVPIDDSAAVEIGRRSRGTPRISNRLLRRVRDFAEVKGDGKITEQIAKDSLKALDVDEFGLDVMDRRILLTLIEKYKGGPVGLETLSIAVSEESDTISDVYEPFLIQSGFLERTSRGRVATERAYTYFKIDCPSSIQGDLLNAKEA